VSYAEHAPAAALAPYVTCFWQLASQGQPHRVLPDGAMDVLFAIGDGAARVIGPMTRAIVTPSGRPGTLVGVRFQPGAAIDLLGVPAQALRDESARVSEVWGARGRALDARLADAPDARTALQALEGELLRRVPSARAPDPRVAHVVSTLRFAGGELPIPAAGAKVGLGERQLLRLFQERVGYGPKLFARVVRLQRSTRSIVGARGSIASWARLAVDCGFADQAHLVREFRALTGVTPTVYARERGVSEIDNPGESPRPTVRA
jgi:AraC-like DNA-binding protein